MTVKIHWQTPPLSSLSQIALDVFKLDPDDVDVWRVSLRIKLKEIESLQQLLSPDERTKASRFHFQQDRQDFIAARGFLRLLLGRYLDVEAQRIRLVYNTYGKPGLADEFASARLCFNVSHSDEFALFAFTRDREIGIDIERIRREVATERIAEGTFARDEVVALRSLPSEMQIEAFFRCWTRKEAFVKARGQGLSIPLDRFVVTLRAQDPVAVISIDGDPRAARAWSLRELPSCAGYVAALAAKGHDWRLKCWECALPILMT
jgi:4'-phosphopantetheinyl transferase